MGSCGGGRLREDANPNSDRTDDRFLFLSLCRFFIRIFVFLRRFVDIKLLETNDINCRKANLEILMSKFHDTMDID